MILLVYSPELWDANAACKTTGLGAEEGEDHTKLVREITLAARLGDPDPAMNARLFAAVEKAKKESVPKDAIQRAINKGAGIGDEKLTIEHVVYEGRAPHNVPVIVEVYTDNVNRTALKFACCSARGSWPARVRINSFLITSVWLKHIIRTRILTLKLPPSKPVPTRFKRLRTYKTTTFPKMPPGRNLSAIARMWEPFRNGLQPMDGQSITSEIGFVPKVKTELTEAQREEVGEFLHALDEHDDVHRVWAAVE